MVVPEIDTYGRPMWLAANRLMPRDDDRNTVVVEIPCVGVMRRLLDAAWTVADDPRIRVVFTTGPDTPPCGVERLLFSVGVDSVPWRDVRARRFGLAITSDDRLAGLIRAPLVVLPSRMGSANPVACRSRWDGTGGGAESSVDTGLGSDHPVRASRTVLAHDTELAQLARTHREEWANAVVVGDSTHDRIVASLALRDFYRRALGICRDQRAVIVAGTWDTRAGLRQTYSLLSRLLAELSMKGYRVFALGAPRCAELSRYIRRGLSVIRPEADWRAPLVAADWIVGDPGALTVYGVLGGAPVLLPESIGNAGESWSHPALAELNNVAVRLHPHGSVRAQLLAAAAGHDPGRYRPVLRWMTSEPGRFNRNMRRLICHALDLPQPPTIPATDPVSPSFPIE